MCSTEAYRRGFLEDNEEAREMISRMLGLDVAGLADSEPVSISNELKSFLPEEALSQKERDLRESERQRLFLEAQEKLEKRNILNGWING